MKIVIPMAGMGKRMRPHTLTVPKPLISLSGKPIVQRLVEEIAEVTLGSIEEIGFVIGDFGKEVENKLISIAESLGAKGKIYYQDEALGTAHAILCAKESLEGNVIVAFADTLFKAKFDFDTSCDASIWVQKVDNPSSFGVVKLNDENIITDFVEKPKEYVSDLAIIGIYYFRDGENLRNELQYLIDNKVVVNGEYQLTDALENMKNKGIRFIPGQVDEWLDCGNKNATVYTNSRILHHLDKKDLVADNIKVKDSVIIEPSFIGEGVVLENSIIGPYASIEKNCKIKNSVISNSMVQEETEIENGNIENSMIGSHAEIINNPESYSLSDYSTIGR
jgi:glucose-1-phosphate thymidylyltransferase